MDSVEKTMPPIEAFQKSLALANQHSAALQMFKKNYPPFQSIYKSTEALRAASKILLATQGINKNILVLQSISAINEMIRNRDFLNQIMAQTPFMAKVQSEMTKFEPLFTSTKTIAGILDSSPLVTSTLSVTMESLNFSSELDKLTPSGQLKILEYLDSLNIDDSTDNIIPDDLPTEIRPEYITLVEIIRGFLQKNEPYILGILSTVETTAKNFSENDFSNVFTIIAFAYFVWALIVNQFEDNDNDGDKN